MGYTANPGELAPAYRPVMWRNRQVIPNVNIIEKLKVDVYVNGQLDSTFRKDWYTSATSAGGTSAIYQFEVDIQGILQDYLTPNSIGKTSMFGTLGLWGVTDNTDSYAYCFLDSYYMYRDGNNLLVESSASDMSSTAFVTQATRQNSEIMGLDDYWYGASSGTVSLLTNMPAQVDIRESESQFLSMIPEGFNSALFTFVGPKYPGGTESVITRIQDELDIGLIKIVTWAAGPAQITSGSPTYLLGTFPTTFTGIEYYQVAGVYYNTATSGITRTTPSKRFNLVQDCPELKKRFYWMNRLGAVDSYTFTGEIEEGQRSGGEILERQLDWNLAAPKHFSYNRGLFKGNITSRKIVKVREIVTAEAAVWLAELFTSPEVYLEVDGSFANVVIEPGEQSIQKIRSNDTEISFTAIVEDQIIQSI